MLFYDGESLPVELPVLWSALPLLRSFLVLSGFGGEPECPVIDLKEIFYLCSPYSALSFEMHINAYIGHSLVEKGQGLAIIL